MYKEILILDGTLHAEATYSGLESLVKTKATIVNLVPEAQTAVRQNPGRYGILIFEPQYQERFKKEYPEFLKHLRKDLGFSVIVYSGLPKETLNKDYEFHIFSGTYDYVSKKARQPTANLVHKINEQIPRMSIP
jgi:hypothetical protein